MFLIGAVWRTQSRKVGGLLVRKQRQRTVDRVLGGACDRRGCYRQGTEWLGGILRVTEGEETGRSEQNHFWVGWGNDLVFKSNSNLHITW